MHETLKTDQATRALKRPDTDGHPCINPPQGILMLMVKGKALGCSL